MKLRGTKDLSIAAVGKYGTLQEFSFFDKVSEAYREFRSRAIGAWERTVQGGTASLMVSHMLPYPCP